MNKFKIKAFSKDAGRFLLVMTILIVALSVEGWLECVQC